MSPVSFTLIRALTGAGLAVKASVPHTTLMPFIKAGNTRKITDTGTVAQELHRREFCKCHYGRNIPAFLNMQASTQLAEMWHFTAGDKITPPIK